MGGKPEFPPYQVISFHSDDIRSVINISFAHNLVLHTDVKIICKLNRMSSLTLNANDPFTKFRKSGPAKIINNNVSVTVIYPTFMYMYVMYVYVYIHVYVKL